MGLNNGNGNGHYDSDIIGHVAYQLGCISPTHFPLASSQVVKCPAFYRPCFMQAGSASPSLVSFPLLMQCLVSPFHSQIKEKYCSIAYQTSPILLDLNLGEEFRVKKGFEG